MRFGRSFAAKRPRKALQRARQRMPMRCAADYSCLRQ